MARFELRGITLELPDAMVRGRLEVALNAGRYESAEADALLRHLRPDDRFLDLGAGLGYLCCLAAEVVGAEAVAGVEAGPETLELARANLARNGFAGARLFHGAVGAAEKGGVTEFVQRRTFWASSLARSADEAKERVVAVPALDPADLFLAHRPTVICCDVEGAELGVLTGSLAPELRLIVVEMHPGAYGPEGVNAIFSALMAKGFSWQPEGSRGATVVFERPGPVAVSQPHRGA